MQRNRIIKRLLMLLFLLSSFLSVRATNVEYRTLNVNGYLVEIVLAEHPIITYTDNTLHIQTAKEMINVPVDQITGDATNMNISQVIITYMNGSRVTIPKSKLQFD